MKLTIILFFVLLSFTGLARANPYPWLEKTVDSSQTLEKRVAPPEGYKRETVPENSFAAWLRALPLKPAGSPVMLYNGKKKFNQLVHAEVIDIDTGKRDLQQCADATMRLRAEYLYQAGQYDQIHFNFTSGDTARFSDWMKGIRPVVKGNKVSWQKRAKPDSDYASFRRFMDTVFTYAGSYSLDKELKTRAPEKMQIGDIFVEGGFPGHAVIIVDMATNPETGEKVFLIAQSYMPAQQIHILKNPLGPFISPWYSADLGKRVITPEWVFENTDLHRFE